MSEDVPRHLRGLCEQVLADTPILVLQGARQVGKSTLARQLSPENSMHVNLDERRWRDYAQEDPEGFVAQHPDGLLVIDEAQRAPELVLALKAAVDSDRRPGRYLLTGSVDLFQTRGVGDSLAGRKESVLVSPFSMGEVERRTEPEDFVPWLLAGAHGRVDPPIDLARMVVGGGFPEPLKRSDDRRAGRWFADYVDALVQHDAAEVSDGPFTDHLASTLRWLATQGQTELVKARLARHLGVAETTADNYLRLIWRMFLARSYPSWGIGIAGRETRRPKVSLLDTGLASFLTGFKVEQAATVGGREFYGLLLEQFVANELAKQREWSDTEYRLYHYRRRDEEVDLIVELADGSLILVEVKAALGVGGGSWQALSAARAQFGDRVKAGVVFYTGSDVLHPFGWLHVLPVWALWRHPPHTSD